eukprot:9702161-Ditylum_brightwellii.AAC.1
MGIDDDITDAKTRSHEQKEFLGALQCIFSTGVFIYKQVGTVLHWVVDAIWDDPSHFSCHQTQDVMNNIQLASN